MKERIRPGLPRQLAMSFDAPVIEGLARRERAQVVSLLAQVLLEATNLDEEEGGDEDL